MDNPEQGTLQELLNVNLETADSTPHRAKRGQHAKHHGAVRAVFSIADNIPEDLRTGLFAKQGTYEAIIRFSNGSAADDRSADAHGMAIKLLDVPGEKLRDGQDQTMAQDFILVDSEVFFTGNLTEYLMFSAGFLRGRRNPLRKLLFGLRMFLFHRPLLRRALAFASNSPRSPLESEYFSSVPYAFGHTAAKFVVKPRAPSKSSPELSSPDGLSKVLVSHLAAGSAIFDFGVDVQTDARTQPIEDPTVKWSVQAGARRAWVAVITIPRQTVDPQSLLAENIAFSPWHALAAHRPLGAINRARRPIYHDLAKKRHELNGYRSDVAESPRLDHTTAPGA